MKKIPILILALFLIACTNEQAVTTPIVDAKYLATSNLETIKADYPGLKKDGEYTLTDGRPSNIFTTENGENTFYFSKDGSKLLHITFYYEGENQPTIQKETDIYECLNVEKGDNASKKSGGTAYYDIDKENKIATVKFLGDGIEYPRKINTLQIWFK